MSSTSLHRTLIVAATVLGLLSACSPAAAPVSDSPRDPSNPSAPEGVAPAVVASTASGSPAPHAGAAPAHGQHDHGQHDHAHHGEAHGATSSADGGAPQGVVYECPMHPEVTSSEPALCPKCNMKLVPRK